MARLHMNIANIRIHHILIRFGCGCSLVLVTASSSPSSSIEYQLTVPNTSNQAVLLSITGEYFIIILIMKHIASLLNSLMPNNNTPFGNKLLASSLMQNNHQILMTDILYLIECFEGFGPECNGIYLSGQEYLQQFFRIVANKPLAGFISIKITLTLHLILYEFQIGEVVADEMAKHENTVRIAPNSQHCQFISNYLMYLMKLGQSLKVFYSCKIG